MLVRDIVVSGVFVGYGAHMVIFLQVNIPGVKDLWEGWGQGPLLAPCRIITFGITHYARGVEPRIINLHGQ
jgi:hypothetical protein